MQVKEGTKPLIYWGLVAQEVVNLSGVVGGSIPGFSFLCVKVLLGKILNLKSFIYVKSLLKSLISY